MNARSKFVSLALASFALLGLMSISASARIVCNTDGDCWHANEDFAYPPAAGIIIHPNDWRWKEGERYSWREHPGRGYWRGGQWELF
jgi:hypothetical protein